jgi:hypothetical protein
MSSKSIFFCPVCNTRDMARRVLSPMVAREVEIADFRPAPVLSYRCERCGFGEIHTRSFGGVA